MRDARVKSASPNDLVSVAKKAYQPYVDEDRALIESERGTSGIIEGVRRVLIEVDGVSDGADELPAAKPGDQVHPASTSTSSPNAPDNA
jgi:hypothetical protein